MSPLSAPVERRWHSLDDGVLAYALAVLRSLWIWPLIALAAGALLSSRELLLAPLTVLALLAGGTLAAQWAIFRLKDRCAAPAAALAGLAAVTAVLYLSVGRAAGPFWDLRWLAAAPGHPGRSLLTVLLAAGLWWWGLRAGRQPVSYDSIARNFTLGLAALLLAMALNASGRFLPPTWLAAILLAFGAVGLFSLALASIQTARRYESTRAGHDLPLARHWWGTVGAAVAVLLLGALLLSQLFAPAAVAALAAGAAGLLAVLGQIVFWLVVAVAYPVILLLSWLAQLLPLPRGAMPPPALPPPDFSSRFGRLGSAGSGSAMVPQALLWTLGGLLVAALIVAAFLLAFRRLRTYAEEDVAEEHESILSLDLLRAQLARLFSRRGSDSSAPADPFVALSGPPAAVSVRRTYQELLAWAAAQGLSRPPGATPEHYAQLLSSAHPGAGQHFHALAAAYDRARYGPQDVSAECAAAAAAAWQQILNAPASTEQSSLPVENTKPQT